LGNVRRFVAVTAALRRRRSGGSTPPSARCRRTRPAASWAATSGTTEYRDTETPGHDNGFAMYLATQCTDAAWPTSVAKNLADDRRTDRQAPLEGSLETRRLFPHSVLLVLPGGTSHANSLDGDACEDDLIAAYLATGALPTRKARDGPDATCKPLPRPVPASVQAPQTLPTAEARNPTAQPATARGRDRP
jgi:hypothetical protein